MYKTGFDPTGTLNFMTSDALQAINLAEEYLQLNGTSPANYEIYNSWYSNLKVMFLEHLQVPDQMNLGIYKLID